MTATAAPLNVRALNRATLARQLLLDRAPMTPADAVSHLLGLQAQNVRPPYFALAARLADFDPEALSARLADRTLVRIVTMRSTIHLHTAEDARTLRPLVQPARTRELGYFRKGLEGVDLDRLTALAQEYVEQEPRTMKQLRDELTKTWPRADPQSLGVAARCLLPLVQVTPRGLWRRGGQVALTTLDHWLGRSSGSAYEPTPRPEDTILRYLAAFGPASVKDFQTWSGLTRTRPAFERLRPTLRTFRDDQGTELFDLPDAPRPAEDTPAPPRFLPEYDNLLLSHADRTRVVPPAYKGRTVLVNQPLNTFLVDGFLAGVWRLQEPKPTEDGPALLTIEPFAPLTRPQRAAVETEAIRLLTGPLCAVPTYDIRFGRVVGPSA